MSDDEITKTAKRNLRQGVPDEVDMFEAIGIAESAQEQAELTAILAKMRQLIKEGYQPDPMPELGKPTTLESGDLRFLAKGETVRKRAEAALASQAVEDWVFYNGEEDEKVTGRVTSIEPVHGLAYFTVKAVEE